MTLGTAAAQTTTTTGRVTVGRVTGTLGLQSTVDKFYSDMHKIIVETTDILTRDTGTNDSTTQDRSEALETFRPGAPVVAQYMVKGIQASADVTHVGPDGQNVNDAVITSVDRARNQITIKRSQGQTETLRLTRHPAQDADGHAHNRVVVYHSDNSGQIVAHYFKPVR